MLHLRPLSYCGSDINKAVHLLGLTKFRAKKTRSGFKRRFLISIKMIGFLRHRLRNRLPSFKSRSTRKSRFQPVDQNLAGADSTKHLSACKSNHLSTNVLADLYRMFDRKLCEPSRFIDVHSREIVV